MSDTTAKTAAETRRDELAARADRLGLIVERNNRTDSAGPLFELIVRSRDETVQVIVRQSKFVTRSTLWAQKWFVGGKPARLAARDISVALARMVPLAPAVEVLDEATTLDDGAPALRDQDAALRANGVTFARIVPGGNAAGSNMTPGTTLLIEGDTFPVPDRSERGGIMAAHRLGEALAAVGYRIDGRDFKEAMTEPLTLRIRLRDFEPIRDADGNPVPMPRPMHSGAPLDVMRQFFAGRVPADCGHYMAQSERRAGLRNCEHCGETDDDGPDVDDLDVDVRVNTPAGPGTIVEWNATEGEGEVRLDRPTAKYAVEYPLDVADFLAGLVTLIRDELVVMPGDDRKIDTDAAARCSAVLADPLTHGGTLSPYLFADGPLGEHVEILCEVHGSLTSARPATPADVERLSVDLPPAPTGLAEVPRPRNGFSILPVDVDPSEVDTDRAATARAFGPMVEALAIAAGGAPAGSTNHEPQQFKVGDDVLDPEGRRAQIDRLTMVNIKGERHPLALVDYFDGDETDDPTPILVDELRPAGPLPQVDGDPVIVEANVENMSSRSSRYEIERAAWESWPPARRRREVETIGDEEMTSAGGYGASVVDGE